MPPPHTHHPTTVANLIHNQYIFLKTDFLMTQPISSGTATCVQTFDLLLYKDVITFNVYSELKIKQFSGKQFFSFIFYQYFIKKYVLCCGMTLELPR